MPEKNIDYEKGHKIAIIIFSHLALSIQHIVKDETFKFSDGAFFYIMSACFMQALHIHEAQGFYIFILPLEWALRPTRASLLLGFIP